MGLQNVICNTAKLSVDILKNNKEKILLGTGLATGLGTVILASKGTLKAKDIVEEHKKRELDICTECTNEEFKQETVKNYVKTGTELVKVYAPAVVMGATSTCCILAQHQMMNNKVVKLEETVASVTAAYIAVDSAFKKYRKRVIDKYGTEEDRYFRFGEKQDTIEVTEMNEKGKSKTTKEKITSVDDLDPSDYAKFFDATSAEFIFQDPEHYKADWDANIRFLNIQQSYANVKLEKQGYLFLNDVYDMLGIKPTKAGQVVGWIFDPEDKTIDSRVNFGIFNPINHRTINGYEEECILLDFNVDGVIIDRIPGVADK